MPAHWFVSGSRGQLGSALRARLAGSAASLGAAAHDELDIADADALRKRLDELPRPLVWANAAAFTHVDRCEREPDLAEQVNARAPAQLAECCAEAGVKLVHVSTDYVFAGDRERAYCEDDPTGPRSVYGRTKLAGERAVLAASPDFLVVRTSWVFGTGRNFLAAILDQAALRRAGKAEGPLRVVDDQRGRPTYASDLADALWQLVEAEASGIVHVANEGVASWWDLARYTLDQTGHADLEIERIATSDLTLDAPRPAWSVLDTARAESLGVRMRDWREAVSDYLGSDDSPLRAAGGAQHG